MHDGIASIGCDRTQLREILGRSSGLRTSESANTSLAILLVLAQMIEQKLLVHPSVCREVIQLATP